MATPAQILQMFQDAENKANEERVISEPSTVKVIKDNKAATATLNMFQTFDNINSQPMPKTYEDFAKIVKIQTAVKPAYTPKMGTAEYVAKSVYSKLVEKPIYALGEGSAAALEAGAKLVGLKGIANYFKESKEMWKTPPATEDVNEQFAWLLDSAKSKSTMHGMVVEMAEIGAQIGSLLIQMGVLGKVPGVKALDLSTLSGTAPLGQVTKQMGTMFAHGVATTPGDLSTRFQAGVTRMAYNMTPYIANWTGATGWGARTIDTALNTFLTSPSYIKSMKEAKNPQEFMMMALPQFMTDVIFALNTTGTPMNQRLKAMGQRPVVFGQKLEEKESFLRGVDKAIGETERPYGEEAPEPTKKQVVASAIAKAKVQKAEEGVLDIYKEPITAQTLRGTKGMTAEQIMQKYPDIQLKRDVTVKDIYGKKQVIPEGTALTPYELKGGKILLQDGETYLVSKNQGQNIMGQSMKAEAKEFAPELAGMEEKVHGDTGKLERERADLATQPQTQENLQRIDELAKTIYASKVKFEGYQEPGGTNYREILVKTPDTGEIGFKGPHWDEPNVLFHLRVNERTDANGKKVLFVEEIQSDWAQKVRQEGEKAVVSDPRLKNWTELVVKRALKEAVNSGAEYMSWTTGKQQAARYSLADKVDAISWVRVTPEGIKRVDIIFPGATRQEGVTGISVRIDKDGKVLDVSNQRGENWIGKKLDEVLPKEITSKILAGRDGRLKGIDLELGGEWAKNLYDKQVKNIVEKLTGEKVEELALGILQGKEKSWNTFIDGEWIPLKRKPKIGDRVRTTQRDSYQFEIFKVLTNDEYIATRMNARGEFEDKSTITIKLNPAVYKQQALKLTPEVIAKVKGEAPKISPTSGRAFVGGPEETALVPSKLKPRKITAGEQPGILLTKTESNKKLALSKKAVADAKMGTLLDPINKGRKLSTEQLPRVASERKNVWEQIGYGWGVLHLGNMRPERMFEELDGYRQGPNTKVGYTTVNKAANDKIEGITNDTEAFKAGITKLGFMPNIDRFYVDRKHVGTQWMLSKNEMVEVYKNMQNPKAIKHLTKSKALNGMGFTKADLAEIKAEVEADPQMKGLVDWQIKEYERWYPIVADIYFKDTGKILPKELYYSPIMVQKEFIDFEKDNYAQELFDRYHIDGYVEKGFTKARQDGATQPIKLDAIGNHMYNINRMQHYVNFALPLKEFKEVMNNPKWREAVTAKKGPTFYKNIKSYYDAVAGTKPAGADEVANKAMGFLRTNAGTAMLGFNILTAMRQPLSIFQATAEIGLPHVLSAIRQFGLNPKGLEAFVYERSKLAKYRQGQFERFMTETEVSLPELLGKPKAPKQLTGRKTIRDKAMTMAIFMDKNTVLTTWKAAYDKVQMTGKTLDGELIPTQDLEKAAMMEADLAVRRTQPMATVKDLPAWHRSSSWLKMFTMFQNQINNNYNYFAHDIIGKTRAGKITPMEAAQKTLFAYVLPAMLLGMIARGGLPRNKKQIAEDIISFPMSGLFFAGGIINSMIKGYSDYGIPPLQFAPDLVKAATSKTWATKGKYGLKGLAEISGIPYNQFARTWKGMQALMAGDTDDWRRLIWSAYSLEKGLPKPVTGGLKVFKRKE